jgi:hypothetical protein
LDSLCVVLSHQIVPKYGGQRNGSSRERRRGREVHVDAACVALGVLWDTEFHSRSVRSLDDPRLMIGRPEEAKIGSGVDFEAVVVPPLSGPRGHGLLVLFLIDALGIIGRQETDRDERLSCERKLVLRGRVDSLAHRWVLIRRRSRRIVPLDGRQTQ